MMLPRKRKPARSGIERAAQREWPRHRRYIRTLTCVVPGCTEVRWPPVALGAVVWTCELFASAWRARARIWICGRS